MPIFICSKCEVIDNTALSGYWTRGFDLPEGTEKPAPLCSQCDPEIGKWHGAFPRLKIRKDHVVGPDGFVHQENDPYLKRLLKETKE